MPEVFGLTEANIAEVFKKWQEAWQKDEAAFASHADHFATEAKTYGESAAAHFVRLAKKLGNF